MHVALERENSRAVAELIRHPVYLAAGRMAARGICPKGAYHIVLLPTAWGYCGAVWKNVGGGRAGERSDFPASCEAKLSRIMTPGLPVSEMRRQLLAEHEGSQEVLCDPHGKFHPGVAPEWLGELAGYLQNYFSDGLRDAIEARFAATWSYWEPRLDLEQLTPFQRAVLTEVAQIPRGVVRTYAEMARRIGKPKAARAVGAALGANPWPVIVPCHRVVGASGAMVGFSAPGGVEQKKRMLAMERGEASKR